MLVHSTKDKHEVEEEEAARLVHPAPKVKPPRRDRRRNTLDVEQDSDVKKDRTVEGDKDLSLNYKGAAVKVAIRFAKQRADLVEAWNRQEKKKVYVSEDTLREQPNVYESYKDQDVKEKAKKQRSQGETERLKSPPSIEKTLTGLPRKTPEIAPTKKIPYKPELAESVAKPEVEPEAESSLAKTKVEKKPSKSKTVPPKTQLEKPDVEKPSEEQEVEKDPLSVFGPLSGRDIQEVVANPEFLGFSRKSKYTKEGPDGKIEYLATDGKYKKFDDLSFEDKQLWVVLFRANKQSKQIERAVSNPEFDTFSRSQIDVKEDEQGRMLFPFEGESVAFDDLPHVAKVEWVNKFRDYLHDASKRRSQRIDLRVIGDLDPEAKQVFQDAVNPESELGKHLAELDKSVLLSKPQQVVPSFKGRVPKSVRNLGEMLEAIKSTYDPPLPSPKKAVTPEEFEEAWALAKDLPPYLQNSVVLKAMHPDDVRELVGQYRAYFSESQPLSPADKKQFLDKAAEEYTTDPRAVRPPDDPEFRSMSRDEQIEAMHAHRMRVVTRSLLAQEMIASEFRKSGLSNDMSKALAEFKLKAVRGESPDQRSARAETLADRTFDEAIISRVAPQSDRSRKSVLRALGNDPDAEKIASAFFKAQDYLSAKKKYLQGGSDLAFNEHSSSNEIVRGLVDAVGFLNDLSKKYRDQRRDVGKAFKVRVLGRLKALNPDKYAEVKQLMEKAEVQQYEKDFPKYTKQYADWKKENDKYLENRKRLELQVETEKERYDKIRQQWEERTRELYEKHVDEHADPKSWPRIPEAPKKPSLLAPGYIESQVGQPPVPPIKPVPPPGYLDYTTDPTAIEKYRQRLTENTYSQPRSMRTAVYHGVEPYKDTPRYVDWKAANPNRLSEDDLAGILKEATRICKELSYYEGASPDSHCRKALDLAIRTARDGAYSVGLPPPLYGRLLERLVEDSGSSVKLAKIGDNNMTAKYSRNQTDSILFRLDKVAATIQQRYAAWGMPFEMAKELVNGLDKVADEIELQAYGKESFERRQAEVLLRDKDEDYMDTFNAPQKPLQADSDEAYMRAYVDDQSAAVQQGTSATGRPLAP